MERAKAFSLLGLTEESDRESWTDALDQAVFQVRDHFMRSPIIPKLYAAKVDRCVLLSDAAQSLGLELLGAPVAMPSCLPTGTALEALIQGHVENIMRCRNVLATTLDPDSIAQVGHLMIQLQKEYMEAFMALTSDLEGSNPESDEAIPARNETDWKALLGAMRAHSQGGNPLFQDLVAFERRRIAALMQTTPA